MNKRINKNVLDGFLNQAISHNKYLEEREMWKKKREESNKSKEKIEKDFSPPPAQKIKQSINKSQQEKEKKTNEDSDEFDDLKVILALYQDQNKKTVERWDHNGFTELYGSEATKKPAATSSTSLSIIKSDHDNNEDSNDDSIQSKRKKKKRKHKHKKIKSKKKRSRSSSSSNDSDSYHKHKKKE